MENDARAPGPSAIRCSADDQQRLAGMLTGYASEEMSIGKSWVASAREPEDLDEDKTLAGKVACLADEAVDKDRQVKVTELEALGSRI